MLWSEMGTEENRKAHIERLERKRLARGMPYANTQDDARRCFCPESNPKLDKHGKPKGWCRTCGGEC